MWIPWREGLLEFLYLKKEKVMSSKRIFTACYVMTN